MTRPRFLLCSSLIPLGLGACSLTAPSAGTGPELPAAWKNAGGFPLASPTQDLSRWWNRFEDPVLERVIGDALKASPDVASAAARVRESRARRNAERAALFPALDGSATASTRTTHSDSAGTVAGETYSAGLEASWEVDLFGKNRSAVAAAAANLGAAEENRHSVQAALAAEIAIAYTSLRATEARFEVLQRNVKTREQTAQLASWRQQAGEADSLEASQALSSLEQARAGIPSLEQAAAQTRNQLALLSGQSPGSLDATLSSNSKGIPNPARSLAVGIPADTLRQRPDVRVAGYQVLAAAATTRVADAARFPSLNLSGSLGLNALRAGKIFNPETTSANLLAGITSPIFDAGRIRSNIQALTAAEDQAVLAYRTTVLTALSETEDALIACRRSAERLASLEKATVSAREADALAQLRYQAGEIDFLDVLDAQRTLLGLEDSLFSTRTDRTTAYIRLYQALGGGWSAGS
ncbi:MAG: efflux transporter outer membrane subunit [Verrucomicrobia bacterium]|nr:efflux transporter outer membrane subunit [Verrucomicrobiota bacterium]